MIAIAWNQHQIVFRQPTRDHIRAFRVMQSSGPAGEADSLDQMTQQITVAFDGETDPVKCRVMYTAFLEHECVAFCSSDKCKAAVASLSGVVEEEDVRDLGKGVTAWPPFRKPSPEVLPNGLATSPAAQSSPTMAVSPLSS